MAGPESKSIPNLPLVETVNAASDQVLVVSINAIANTANCVLSPISLISSAVETDVVASLNVALGTTTLQIQADKASVDKLVLQTLNAPHSNTYTGMTPQTIYTDGNYLYVVTSNTHIRRVALEDF